MDGEKKIEAWQQELITVRSGMEEMGPVVIGTISSSRKKYRTKDGEERVCGDTAVLKFAGTGKNLTVRIPKDKEKLVRKMIDNGRKWRDLNKRYILLSSRLAVYGALKKLLVMPTPKFANLQEILAEESDAETGAVSEKTEERLEVEMRRTLIDFFEQFFLECALFHPIEGSRGMRTETILTRFGKVRVVRRYVIKNKERPGFVGRVGRCTKACEIEVAGEGCDRSSFKRAEAVARSRGIDISASKIREVTLRRGKAEYESPTSATIDLTPAAACAGKRRRTKATMVVSTDGTCAPCAKKDLEGVEGRDGNPATGRNVDVGMVAVYNSVRREDNRPVIPPSSRKYVIAANADGMRTRLRETALAAGYGAMPRVQFIGDGAPWIENIRNDSFAKAVFTLDCSHAFGYVNKVCEFLAADAKEAKKIFRKVKDRMYEHDFERAEKYLKNKYKAWFTDDGFKQWDEEAMKAWKYLDARRRQMNYGWLRRHGYLIGSGHIESACKVIIGQRCKGAGMHWRYENALYVTALRARMRSAA